LGYDKRNYQFYAFSPVASYQADQGAGRNEKRLMGGRVEKLKGLP
jgi:hypothetical protein